MFNIQDHDFTSATYKNIIFSLYQIFLIIGGEVTRQTIIC